MVEEETCCSFGFAIECGHGFGLLGEVIDYHDNVLVAISRNGVDGHEVDCPFAKGSDCDYGV